MERFMNCIFLLLLLSCCGGWGNGCCGDSCRGNGCCRNDDRGNGCGCRETGRGNRMDGCCDGRDRADRGCGDRDHDRHHESRHSEPCCREQERPCPEPEPCGCAREERACDCDGPSSGIIPPPWQEYPRFPRRDNGENCES